MADPARVPAEVAQLPARLITDSEADSTPSRPPFGPASHRVAPERSRRRASLANAGFCSLTHLPRGPAIRAHPGRPGSAHPPGAWPRAGRGELWVVRMGLMERLAGEAG